MITKSTIMIITKRKISELKEHPQYLLLSYKEQHKVIQRVEAMASVQCRCISDGFEGQIKTTDQLIEMANELYPEYDWTIEKKYVEVRNYVSTGYHTEIYLHVGAQEKNQSPVV